MAGRAPEVPLASVLAVAVGGGARLVEPQAAHLLALGKVCRPDEEASAQPSRVAVLDAVAHVDRRPELVQRRVQRLEHTLAAAICGRRLRLVQAHAHPRRLTHGASSAGSATRCRPPATAPAPARLIRRLVHRSLAAPAVRAVAVGDFSRSCYTVVETLG